MGTPGAGKIEDNPRTKMTNFKTKYLKKLLLFGLILSISGCGYTTGALLPAHLKTIHIRPFRNRIELAEELTPDQYRFRSYRPHMETDITKEVIARFISDGHLKVVEEENADLILSGELIDYLREPVRYGADNETVEEYRLSIVSSIEVQDVRKGKLFWKEPRLIGDATYHLSGPYAISESSCISNAVSDLARRIANRTLEGW